MNDKMLDTLNIIEACIFGANQDVTLAQLSDIFNGTLSTEQIENYISDIKLKYQDNAIELFENNHHYRFRTKQCYQEFLNKINNHKPYKYSRAVMETLTIIAYMQPITRGEIENIRGVTTNSNAIQTLMERDWIEIVGHKQIPGRPELLATTDKFLKDLGLSSISQLPPYDIPDNSNLKIDFINEYDNNKL